MPDEFINAEGNNVTNAYKQYLRPPLGSDMPEAARFRAPAVKIAQVIPAKDRAFPWSETTRGTFLRCQIKFRLWATP